MKANYRLIGQAVRERLAKQILIDPQLDDHTVVIRPYKSKRSLDQNDCMWGMIRAVSKEQGHDAEQLQQHCSRVYGGSTPVIVFGESLEVLNFQSSKANVKEMSDFLEWLEPYLATNSGMDLRRYR